MSFSVIDSFIKVAHKFLQVVQHENQLMDEGNLTDGTDLVRQKQKIADQYALLAEKLPESFDREKITQLQKEELKSVVNELAEKLQENENRLSISLASNERMLDLIVGSYKKKGTSNCYYNKAGYFRRQSATISMVSLDTKL